MNLLPIWILVSVLICSSFSSITLSCFSFPILDLPSLGFSSSSGLYLQSGVNFLTNVGANTTATVDGCLWGLASLLLLEILPTLLSGEAAQLFDRISGVSSFSPSSHSPDTPSSTAPAGGSSQTGYADYDNYGAIDTGNRRLDVNDYEYILDTSPTNLYHNPFHGHPQADLEVAGLQVTPYGGGNGLEVTPILADTDTVQWSQPILSNNDFGWSEPKKMLGPSFQQDYDDIDYTSGGLVTFHSSLS